MAVVRIDGWEDGFQKVSFSKLLRTEAGLTLSSAHATTCRVVDGDVVDINVSCDADAFADRCRSLGAKCHVLEESTTER